MVPSMTAGFPWRTRAKVRSYPWAGRGKAVPSSTQWIPTVDLGRRASVEGGSLLRPGRDPIHERLHGPAAQAHEERAEGADAPAAGFHLP